MSARVAGLAEAGLLAIADPSRAASHFLALTVSEVMNRSYYDAHPVDDAESAHLITAGVDAFLHGYVRRPARG
ncbi:MAG TPA: TetR/AcrR family transcriptional regulator C-terminal domain-containing protein [Acidimicrobiales bacterium]